MLMRSSCCVPTRVRTSAPRRERRRGSRRPAPAWLRTRSVAAERGGALANRPRHGVRLRRRRRRRRAPDGALKPRPLSRITQRAVRVVRGELDDRLRGAAVADGVAERLAHDLRQLVGRRRRQARVVRRQLERRPAGARGSRTRRRPARGWRADRGPRGSRSAARSDSAAPRDSRARRSAGARRARARRATGSRSTILRQASTRRSMPASDWMKPSCRSRAMRARSSRTATSSAFSCRRAASKAAAAWPTTSSRNSMSSRVNLRPALAQHHGAAAQLALDEDRAPSAAPGRRRRRGKPDVAGDRLPLHRAAHDVVAERACGRAARRCCTSNASVELANGSGNGSCSEMRRPSLRRPRWRVHVPGEVAAALGIAQHDDAARRVEVVQDAPHDVGERPPRRPVRDGTPS